MLSHMSCGLCDGHTFKGSTVYMYMQCDYMIVL